MRGLLIKPMPCKQKRGAMGYINLDNINFKHLVPEASQAMIDAIKAEYGNPSSQHQKGDEAREVLESSRETVARLINAKDPREIVFTSCGTESVNMAVKGLAWARQDKGKHLVTCNTEHNAVIRSLRRLKQLGFQVTSVPVDKYGVVNPQTVKRAIRESTILVTIMHANNEIGTLHPIAEIAAVCREAGVAYHCDAVDSVGTIPIDVEALGIDLLSFASNPFYGPKGVGALYVRRGIGLWNLLDGGAQENRKRAGTENLVGIVGMAAAAKVAMRDMEKRLEHYKNLRRHFLAQLPKYLEDYLINGHPEQCLPNHISLSVRHVEGESIVLMLDEQGFAVSTRSACASGSLRASHVLLSTGLSFADAQGTLVISFGTDTTTQIIDNFLAALAESVKTLRAISPLYAAAQKEKAGK